MLSITTRARGAGGGRKNARVALRSTELKKLKSLEVEAAKCAKLTELFGAVTLLSPRQQQQLFPRVTKQTDAVSNVNLGLGYNLGYIFEIWSKQSKKTFLH